METKTTVLQTKIIGQQNTVATLNKILPDPPHIIITGPSGCGKTTLADDFLKAYFGESDTPNILRLSAEKDRGMTTIRSSLSDFVRQSMGISTKKRWVLIDDADTFPPMSQQAIRRPMEQYSHLTRFIFISTSISDLILPIRSRCLHLQVSPLALAEYGHAILESRGIPCPSPQIQDWLISASLGIPAEYIHFADAVSMLENPSLSEVQTLCAAPPFDLTLPIIKTLMSQGLDNTSRLVVNPDNEKLLKALLDIWFAGYGFEDILDALYKTADLFLVLESPSHEKLLSILAAGWESQIRGRCGLLDLLRLFFGISGNFC